MKTLRHSITVALVVALTAVPTAALATDDVGTETRPETDQTVSDRPSDRPHDLSEIKARALGVIDKQLEVLSGLRAKIDGAPHITNGHAGRLLGEIGATSNGLESLARQIEAATTPEELRRLIEQLGDYKIKQVLAPKTFQVIASDTLVFAAGRLEAYSERLAEIVARFEDAGFEVDQAWRLLEEMNNGITEAIRLAGPVAENVIGLRPGDWPDPAQSILTAGRSNLGTARQNVRAAHANGKEIVEFLHGLVNRTDVATDAARTDAAPAIVG